MLAGRNESLTADHRQGERNREVGLVITEPDGVATMQSTFETDWAAATPFGG